MPRPSDAIGAAPEPPEHLRHEGLVHRGHEPRAVRAAVTIAVLGADVVVRHGSTVEVSPGGCAFELDEPIGGEVRPRPQLIISIETPDGPVVLLAQAFQEEDLRRARLVHAMFVDQDAAHTAWRRLVNGESGVRPAPRTGPAAPA